MVVAIAKQDTPLKDSPRQYDECDWTYGVKAGTRIELKSYTSLNDVKHYHLKPKEPIDGQSCCMVYSPHWEIEGTEKGNNPVEAVPTNAAELPPLIEVPSFKVPGITAPVKVNQPIYYDGKQPSNFVWGELTNNGERIPEDDVITGQIIRLAKYMDKVRQHLGDKPIGITSGYRDPRTNRRIGGASRSQHLSGNAVDFYVVGQGCVETFERLKGYHPSGGLAVGNGFVHIDLRPGAARWAYPGGPRVALW